MNYLRSFAVLIVIAAFVLTGCGSKNQTTDKKDGNTQTTQTTQTQTTTQTTQKTDSVKPKTDSVKTDKTMSDKPNTVIMETSLGNMTIELYADDAPKHVENFKKLVDSKFYDGLLFHRVINGFMIQGGDPNTRKDDKSMYGQGGPGYTIPAEIKRKHEKGSLAAARLGDQANPKRESSGSQFYIVTGEASHLDGQYTVFGKVTMGLDVAMKIQSVRTDANDLPVEKVVIKKVYFEK